MGQAPFQDCGDQPKGKDLLIYQASPFSAASVRSI